MEALIIAVPVIIAALTFVSTQIQLTRTAHRDDVADLRRNRDECLEKLATLEGTVNRLREENLFLMKQVAINGKR